MRIDIGSTRLVLLVGTRAIKVPNFGLLRTFMHALRLCMPGHRQWRDEKIASYAKGGTFLRAAFNYVALYATMGIMANRQEKWLWEKHPELPIARVTHMYLFGFILVMERGEPVAPPLSEPLRSRFRAFCECDFDQPHHICSFGNGDLRYIDFGHPAAPRGFGVA